MLNHCFLSVDYSDEWEKVLEFLPPMSKLLGIKHLTLIYVVEVFRRNREWDTKETAAERLGELAARLQSDLHIKVDHIERRGLAASETLKAAESAGADGVITLNRSHSAGREVFLGNTALNLARMATLPLLVLPLDGSLPSPTAPIVLATDCSKSAKGAQAQFGALIGAGAKGIVLSVIEADYVPGSSEDGTTVASIADQYEGVEGRTLTGHPIEGILGAAEDEKAALIILGKRGNTTIADLPLGSTAEGVARSSRQPVLLVPG